MDFLNPQKQRAHVVRLIVGYVLIGLAVFGATIVLLYQAHGFGVGKNGQVVQNGFVFMSSQPQNAQIYIDNKLSKDTTSARLQMAEGTYNFQLRRDGYHPWGRRVDVVGGTVTRFDYPLLIPTTLTPTPVHSYTTPPAFASQSPDRRWLIVQQTSSVLGFDVYDLGDPKKVAANAVPIALPTSIVTTPAAPGQSWSLLEWSTDNQHIILTHAWTGGSEYILVDRSQPDKSINLTKTLNLSAGEVLSLRDKKYDKYYIFNSETKSLTTATLDTPTAAPVLSGILAYKSYGSDMILYATEAGATPGHVMTMLKDGDVTYKIREVGVGVPYLMDLAQYNGDWYVAVGAGVDNKVYVFKNPEAVRKSGKVSNLVPVQILRVTAPNYLAFSSNTRFIMIENSSNFAIYDAETDKGYTYASAAPLDPAQPHATWMDGDRITYVSGGKVVEFDYDNINSQTLVASAPTLGPFFDRDYHFVYTLTPATAATGQSILMSTSLRAPKDQ